MLEMDIARIHLDGLGASHSIVSEGRILIEVGWRSVIGMRSIADRSAERSDPL